MWIPDNNILEVTSFDFDTTTRPGHLIDAGSVLVHGVGELEHVDRLTRLELGLRSQLLSCFCLVEEADTFEGCDADVIGRSAKVGVEERLEFKGT